MPKKLLFTFLVWTSMVVISGALFAGGTHAQTPTATPTAAPTPCQGSMVWPSPVSNVTFNAAPQIVTSVCVQLASSTSGQIGNVTSPNGCYTITGVGTTSASVTRASTTAACQATNIYAQVGNPTPTPAPTAAATATPPRTATPAAPAATAAPAGPTTPAAPAATVAPVTAPKTGNAGLLGNDRMGLATFVVLSLVAAAVIGARYASRNTNA